MFYYFQMNLDNDCKMSKKYLSKSRRKYVVNIFENIFYEQNLQIIYLEL